MSSPCVRCAEPIVTETCPHCGEVQPTDPLVGTVVSERYEIIELLSIGGMARIYRAVQRSLNRPVVVKVIDPELLSGDEETADEAVQRFMVEAQAASRLNHPNVISVIDFGRAAEEEGGYLFLVMEYLAGRDLRQVMNDEAPLDLARIGSILRQTLAALVEAHFIGITHRDVKPDNIILEARRRGDHVKVIDFGLAKLGSNQSVTRVGKTLGTPHYMAPEQIRGDALGSGDLYAVGVILYELLTGEVPFDGGSPIEILQKHVSAERPDPRSVGSREIPDELAEVCMRAMAIDPADRFPSAEAFSDAIEQAAGSGAMSERLSLTGMSLPPPRPSMPPSVPRPAPRAAAPEIEVSSERAVASSFGPELVARDDVLAWGCEMLEREEVGAIVLTGPPGVGRTRMTQEIGACVELEGAFVAHVRPPPRPRQEVGMTTARAVVARLLDLEEADATRLAAEVTDEPLVAAGLRAIFAGEITRGPSGAVQTRRGVAHALAWAVRRASEQHEGAHVVLVVDDLDAADGVSRQALFDVVAKPPPGRFTLLASMREEDVELAPERSVSRALEKLAPADAALLATSLRRGVGGERVTRAVEPLYLTLLHRWGQDRPGARPPLELEQLVEWRVTTLRPAERRVLLASAVIGGGSRVELAALTRPKDLDEALEPLVTLGLLERAGDGVSIPHEIFGRVLLGVSPAGAISELRKKHADALAAREGALELRAYHAIRTQPDFETFMLVEDCASLRSQRGDEAGAIGILTEGFQAGHTMLARGDAVTGKSACVVFGQKLAASLAKTGEPERALKVLEEALSLLPARDANRVPVLDELARIALRLGRPDADKYRREASVLRRPLER